MILTIIGMSGAGKTTLAKQLSENGFRYYGCDDLIENKLHKEFKALNLNGINDVSRWMGQPFDQRYGKTSRSYLDFEQQAMEEIIGDITSSSPYKHTVIDTTGSVIYINKNILRKLKKLTKVIYLKISKELEEQMFKMYLKDPKPVVWGKMYQQKANEDPYDALKRCYRNLLRFRSRQYQEYADSTIENFLINQKYYVSRIIDQAQLYEVLQS